VWREPPYFPPFSLKKTRGILNGWLQSWVVVAYRSRYQFLLKPYRGHSILKPVSETICELESSACKVAI
jgi:hypothetical protein